MNSGFGRWVIEHRGARIGLIAGFLPLPMTSVFSAAIVVAVVITKGWREAVIDCGIALLVLGLVTIVAGGLWTQIVASGLSTWSAAIFLGVLTGAYGSLTLPLQALIVICLLALTIFTIGANDPVAFWEKALTDFAAQMSEIGMEMGEPGVLLELAPMMSGLVAASIVVSSMLALIVGTWWASAAGGPAFREMFVSIRLGYILGGLAVLAGLAAMFLPGHAADNALLLFGVGFVFQGLAVVHWLVAARGLPWMVLLPVYLPFFMGASIAVMALFLLASVGFVDNWYGLRRAGPSAR